MNMRKHARLIPRGREILVRRILEEGLRVVEVAQASGAGARTAREWLARHRAHGRPGPADRPSRPRRRRRRASPGHRARIVALPRQRLARRRVSRRAVRAWARPPPRRHGLDRPAPPGPPPAANRRARDRPGDPPRLDTRKLGCFRRPGHHAARGRRAGSPGAGWEHARAAIDDASRAGLAAIAADEMAGSACRALLKTLRCFATASESPSGAS